MWVRVDKSLKGRGTDPDPGPALAPIPGKMRQKHSTSSTGGEGASRAKLQSISNKKLPQHQAKAAPVRHTITELHAVTERTYAFDYFHQTRTAAQQEGENQVRHHMTLTGTSLIQQCEQIGFVSHKDSR